MRRTPCPWTFALLIYINDIFLAAPKLSFHLFVDNIKPFYEHLNILPLTENIKLLQGKFMWKLLAKKHPDSIIEQFPLHFNEAINNTNSEKLIIPYYRTSIGKKSLLYQGYKIWNLEIPANIKNKESYNNFAKNYHKYILD